MKYDSLFLSKTRKDVAKFVICCNPDSGALRVNNYIGIIIAIDKSLHKNHTGHLNVYLKLLYIYILVLLKTVLSLNWYLNNHTAGPLNIYLKLLYVYKLVLLKTVLSFGILIIILVSLLTILNFCIFIYWSP